ncbi:MAG: sensor domain-containing diguanylate cyclase [Chloroflexota bacterium]|nr:sensor domain-containing diguanylate cyclase [Chloroflexota bacterium]
MRKVPPAYAPVTALPGPVAGRASRWAQLGRLFADRRRDSRQAEFLSLFSDAALLDWGMQVRWWGVAALLLLGAVLLLAGAFSPARYFSTALLALPVLAYNALFLLLSRLKWFADNERILRALRWIQLPADLIAITVLLHLTGGATTPLTITYVFTIVVAILLVPVHGTYFAAAIASLCYGALALLELTILPPVPLLLLSTTVPQSALGGVTYGIHWTVVVGMLWLVAYVADRLVQRMRAGERLITRQLADLRLLYRFSDNLTAAPNLDAAAQYVVSELHTILQADTCSLMVLNQHHEAEFRAAVGIPPEALAAYRRHPLTRENPLLASVLSGGSGVFAPDVDRVAGLRAVLLRPGICSFYSFPLRAEERIVGLINLTFDRPYSMPAATYDLMELCSRQAGLTLERTLLYQEAQRAAREMESLYHIGLATSSSLDIRAVLSQIADQVQRVMALDSLVLALYNAQQGTLDFVIQREGGKNFPREVLPLNEVGVSGWIITSQTPLLVRDWDREIHSLPFVDKNQIGDASQSYVGVPLTINNRIIGVLSVQKREAYAYDDNHLRLLLAIAAQAALALENAKLHNAARRQALRDSLTGAYNHATLLAHIDQAVRQARLDSKPVSLIMLDIDLFKRYNDTYGHVAGDTVLQLVVRAIVHNIKSGDSVGRWGGEEFGVLLPGANGAAALRVAARIRATLAAIQMPVQGGRRLPLPTASQGIASYPASAATPPELVDQADAALYHAKAQGRDRIITWDDLAALTHHP